MARLWIIIVVLLNAAGWLLSGCGQLNAVGYLCWLIPALVGAFLWHRRFIDPPRFHWPKIRHRFRHLYPALFAITAILALIGGLLHPPNSGDSLQYRIPRMLHWWLHGGWFWIPTLDARMNTRATNFEWTGMPLLIFTRTDRWLFLPSFISLLLLPGLIYSLFIRLRVPRRVAWTWMWILPTGYVYLTQAGSTQNDLFSVPFALGSVLFALRSRERRSVSDACLSFWCICLLSSAKSSNLPLMLPGLIALLPVARLALCTPITSLAVFLAGLLVSFAPTAFLNSKYAGEWTGYRAEGRLFMATDPIVATAGNTFMIAVQNLVPPIFPFASGWNRVAPELFPLSFREKLLANMEDRFWEVREIVAEERAGLGLGIGSLLALSLVLARKHLRRTRKSSSWLLRALWVSPYVALCAYMAKCGVNAGARLISPYYLLLIPPLLQVGDQAAIVRQRVWRWWTVTVFLLGFVVLITMPARPLWPAVSILTRLQTRFPRNPAIARAKKVYAVFARRNDGMAPLRKYLPPDCQKVGAISHLPDAITSLWRPFGSRTVEYVLPHDTPESLRTRGIEYIVLRDDLVPRFFGKPVDEWLHSMAAEVVGRASIDLYYWSEGERDWTVARLTSPNDGLKRSGHIN